MSLPGRQNNTIRYQPFKNKEGVSKVIETPSLFSGSTHGNAGSVYKVDISLLMKQYKPGGASSYHPRMLLKTLVYAYINNIYSSRRIEQALQESVYFMWLTGMSKPDHNTINRFRGQRLYTDGTKIEANANRYTFVWGKAIKTSRERIKQQLDELWKYAESVAASEMDDTDPSGFEKIDKEKVTATVEKINAALRDKEVNPKVRQKLNYARKHWPAALDKYEQQEKIIGTQRSSYSKTDMDRNKIINGWRTSGSQPM